MWQRRKKGSHHQSHVEDSSWVHRGGNPSTFFLITFLQICCLRMLLENQPIRSSCSIANACESTPMDVGRDCLRLYRHKYACTERMKPSFCSGRLLHAAYVWLVDVRPLVRSMWVVVWGGCCTTFSGIQWLLNKTSPRRPFGLLMVLLLCLELRWLTTTTYNTWWSIRLLIIISIIVSIVLVLDVDWSEDDCYS